MSARPAHREPPGVVTGNPHLEGVFAPVTAEVDVAALEVLGSLPPELDGAYLRNGPNPRFTPLGSYVIPLDGDGMVHRVVLRDGTARYTNRFVRTPALRTEEAAGRVLWAGITDAYTPDADAVGPALAGTVRELPDINVVRHRGRLLALAESDRPYRLDPVDLDTVGVETFGGSQPAGITAHPKVDPRTGDMVVFCYHLGPPYLTWATIAADGSGSSPVPVAGLGRPVMIHDMALTEHYVVRDSPRCSSIRQRRSAGAPCCPGSPTRAPGSRSCPATVARCGGATTPPSGSGTSPAPTSARTRPRGRVLGARRTQERRRRGVRDRPRRGLPRCGALLARRHPRGARVPPVGVGEPRSVSPARHLVAARPRG